MTVLHKGQTMTIFLENARIIDPEGDTVTPGNLVIDGGVIAAIGAASAPRGAQVIDCNGACLAPGIIDWGVKIGEPGERHRESFRSIGLAAAAGGVTTLIARPDTTPAIDTPEVLEFVTRRAAEASPVRIRHMAALTKGRAGREMTEIGFLLDAGAIAFTDATHVASDTRALGRALTYARSLGALVIGHPQDQGLSAGASATSGKFASLRGIPAVHPMAERIGLDRDLGLVEMTGARYHADQITTARSLPALERAKKNGLDVTAGVSIHHLTLNEFDLGDYRTFFKLTPPLRSEDDRLAMIEAVASGLIDVICSFHTPADEESKRLPFEDAASGAVGVETLLPAALRLYHAGQLSLPHLFRALALIPARRLGLPQGRMAEGAPADLVLFDPDAPFVLDRFSLLSKSKNTPFDGARMEGKVLATFVGGRAVFGPQVFGPQVFGPQVFFKGGADA
jgi:dihydroorotase